MTSIFRTDAFGDLASLGRNFSDGRPFPHLVIDNILRPEIADALHDEARSTLTNVDASNVITQKLKVACTDWTRFGPVTHRVISILNSGEFLDPLEKITDLSGLQIGRAHV